MNYYVMKNGKSIRRFQSADKAILYAMFDLEYDSVDDSVAVVNGTGYYVWQP